MANGITIDITAQIVGYEKSLDDIKKAAKNIDIGSDIGKNFGKQIDEAEKKLQKLKQNPTPTATSYGGIANIVNEVNDVGERLKSLGAQFGQLQMPQLNTSSIAGEIEAIQQRITELQTQMNTGLDMDLSKVIGQSEELSGIFKNLQIDSSKMITGGGFDALTQKAQELSTAYDEAAQKAREAQQVVNDLNTQKQEIQANQAQNQANQAMLGVWADPQAAAAEAGAKIREALMGSMDKKFAGNATQVFNSVFGADFSKLDFSKLEDQIREFYSRFKGEQSRAAAEIGMNSVLGNDPEEAIAKIIGFKPSDLRSFVDELPTLINKMGLTTSQREKASLALKEGDRSTVAEIMGPKFAAEDVQNQAQELAINQQIPVAQDNAAKAQETANSLQEQIQTLKSIKTQLESDLQTLKQQYEALQQQIKQSQAEIENKKQQLLDETKAGGKGGGDLAAANQIPPDSMRNYEAELDRINSKQQALGKIKGVVQRWFSVYAAVRMVRQAIQSVVKTITELDKTITKISIVTSMSSSDLWSAMGQYTAMAQQYGASISGVYEVSQLYYQQGLQTADVMTLTASTLKMAQISGLDYATATNYMTNAIRSFKMEQQEANTVTDVYAALAASSASSVQELATAMSKTASSAQAVGTSFQETAAMMAVMIEATREAPENIGSAMKSIISRYGELKESPKDILNIEGEEISLNKVDKALQTVGISIHDAQGQFRGFGEVIAELSTIWDTLDSNTQRYIATVMAGNRQQSRFLALVSSGERYEELLDTAENSEDAGTLQQLKTMDSVETKAQQVKTALQSVYTSAGIEKLLKGWYDFEKAVVTTLARISNTQGIVGAISKIASTFITAATLVTNAFKMLSVRWSAQYKAIEQERNNEAQKGAATRGQISENEKQKNLADRQAEVQGQQNTELQRTDAAELGSAQRQKISLKERLKTQTGRMAAGMVASTAGLMLTADAAGIDEQADHGKRRQEKAIKTTLGGALSGLGTGLMIGGPIAGPIIGILTALPGIFEGIGLFTESTIEKLERLKKETEEATTKSQQSSAETRNLGKEIQELEKLKAAQYDSAEARQAFLDQMNEMANSYPSLITAYDNEGNAIISVAEAYQLLHEKRMQALTDSKTAASAAIAEANAQYEAAQATYRQVINNTPYKPQDISTYTIKGITVGADTVAQIKSGQYVRKPLGDIFDPDRKAQIEAWEESLKARYGETNAQILINFASAYNSELHEGYVAPLIKETKQTYNLNTSELKDKYPEVFSTFSNLLNASNTTITDIFQFIFDNWNEVIESLPKEDDFYRYANYLRQTYGYSAWLKSNKAGTNALKTTDTQMLNIANTELQAIKTYQEYGQNYLNRSQQWFLGLLDSSDRIVNLYAAYLEQGYLNTRVNNQTPDDFFNSEYGKAYNLEQFQTLFNDNEEAIFDLLNEYEYIGIYRVNELLSKLSTGKSSEWYNTIKQLLEIQGYEFDPEETLSVIGYKNLDIQRDFIDPLSTILENFDIPFQPQNLQFIFNNLAQSRRYQLFKTIQSISDLYSQGKLSIGQGNLGITKLLKLSNVKASAFTSAEIYDRFMELAFSEEAFTDFSNWKDTFIQFATNENLDLDTLGITDYFNFLSQLPSNIMSAVMQAQDKVAEMFEDMSSWFNKLAKGMNVKDTAKFIEKIDKLNWSDFTVDSKGNFQILDSGWNTVLDYWYDEVGSNIQTLESVNDSLISAKNIDFTRNGQNLDEQTSEVMEYTKDTDWKNIFEGDKDSSAINAWLNYTNISAAQYRDYVEQFKKLSTKEQDLYDNDIYNYIQKQQEAALDATRNMEQAGMRSAIVQSTSGSERIRLLMRDFYKRENPDLVEYFDQYIAKNENWITDILNMGDLSDQELAKIGLTKADVSRLKKDVNEAMKSLGSTFQNIYKTGDSQWITYTQEVKEAFARAKLTTFNHVEVGSEIELTYADIANLANDDIVAMLGDVSESVKQGILDAKRTNRRSSALTAAAKDIMGINTDTMIDLIQTGVFGNANQTATALEEAGLVVFNTFTGLYEVTEQGYQRLLEGMIGATDVKTYNKLWAQMQDTKYGDNVVKSFSDVFKNSNDITSKNLSELAIALGMPVTSLIKQFNFELNEMTGNYRATVQTLEEAEKLIFARYTDPRERNAALSMIKSASPELEKTKVWSDVVKNYNELSIDTVRDLANITGIGFNVWTEQLLADNKNGTYKVKDIGALKSIIDWNLGENIPQSIIDSINSIFDETISSFIEAVNSAEQGFTDTNKMREYVDALNNSGIFKDKFTMTEGAGAIFEWDNTLNAYTLNMQGLAAQYALLQNQMTDMDSDTEQAAKQLLEANKRTLAQKIDISGFLQSGRTLREFNETIGQNIDNYNQYINIVGGQVIDKTKVWSGLWRGGDAALQVLTDLEEITGKTFSQQERTEFYRSRVDYLLNTVSSQLNTVVGSVVDTQTAVILNAVQSGSVVKENGVYIVTTAIQNIGDAYLRFLNMLRTSAGVTISEINAAAAQYFAHRQGNEQEIIDLVSSGTSLTYDAFGEFLSTFGIEMSTGLIKALEDSGITRALGGNKMAIMDWSTLAKQLKIDPNSPEYVRAFSAYNDALIKMDRETTSNILSQVKELSEAGPESKINLTYLWEGLSDRAQRALSHQMEQMGALLENGVLTLGKNANLLEIIPRIQSATKYASDLTATELVELNQVLIDAVQSYISAISSALQGNLDEMGGLRLQQFAETYGINLDFTRTADGLKLSVDQAIQLYIQLQKIDQVSAQGLFKNIAAEFKTLNNHLVETGGLTQRIKEVEAEIVVETAKGTDAEQDRITALQTELSLLKQMKREQMQDSKSYDWKKDLPGGIQAIENAFNSPFEIQDTVRAAFKESGPKRGLMKYGDYYNMLQYYQNLADETGDFTVAGMEFKKGMDSASKYWKAGIDHAQRIKGEDGLYIDLSTIAPEINFENGEYSLDNVSSQLQALAQQNVKILDEVIAVLEVAAQMEKLGEIDADSDNVIDIDELLPKFKAGDKAETGVEYHETVKGIAEYLNGAKKDNEELASLLNNVVIGGHRLADYIDDAADGVWDLNVSTDTLSKVWTFLQKWGAAGWTSDMNQAMEMLQTVYMNTTTTLEIHDKDGGITYYHNGKQYTFKNAESLAKKLGYGNDTTGLFETWNKVSNAMQNGTLSDITQEEWSTYITLTHGINVEEGFKIKIGDDERIYKYGENNWAEGLNLLAMQDAIGQGDKFIDNLQVRKDKQQTLLVETSAGIHYRISIDKDHNITYGQSGDSTEYTSREALEQAMYDQQIYEEFKSGDDFNAQTDRQWRISMGFEVEPMISKSNLKTLPTDIQEQVQQFLNKDENALKYEELKTRLQEDFQFDLSNVSEDEFRVLLGASDTDILAGAATTAQGAAEIISSAGDTYQSSAQTFSNAVTQFAALEFAKGQGQDSLGNEFWQYIKNWQQNNPDKDINLGTLWQEFQGFNQGLLESITKKEAEQAIIAANEQTQQAEKQAQRTAAIKRDQTIATVAEVQDKIIRYGHEVQESVEFNQSTFNEREQQRLIKKENTLNSLTTSEPLKTSKKFPPLYEDARDDKNSHIISMDERVAPVLTISEINDEIIRYGHEVQESVEFQQQEFQNRQQRRKRQEQTQQKGDWVTDWYVRPEERTDQVDEHKFDSFIAEDYQRYLDDAQYWGFTPSDYTTWYNNTWGAEEFYRQQQSEALDIWQAWYDSGAGFTHDANNFDYSNFQKETAESIYKYAQLVATSDSDFADNAAAVVQKLDAHLGKLELKSNFLNKFDSNPDFSGYNGADIFDAMLKLHPNLTNVDEMIDWFTTDMQNFNEFKKQPASTSDEKDTSQSQDTIDLTVIGEEGAAAVSQINASLAEMGTKGAATATNISQALSDIHGSITGDVTIKVSAEGTGVVGVKGQNVKGTIGTAFAKGTLMGELGPELVVSGGRYFLAGQNGAEFVDLDPDAIVFNHLQTKRLMSSGTGGRGTPLVDEKHALSYAKGNVNGGPALAGASAALAELKRIRAMWAKLADMGISDLAKKGGGGGGGGGGEVGNFLGELERWYNLLQRIAKLEKDINYEEKLRSKIESDRAANGKAYYESYKRQADAIKQSTIYEQELLSLQEDRLHQRAADLEDSFFGKFYRWNEEEQIIEFVESGTDEHGNPIGFQMLADELYKTDKYGKPKYNAEEQYKILTEQWGLDPKWIEYDESGKLIDFKAEGGYESAMKNFDELLNSRKDEINELNTTVREGREKVLDLAEQHNKLLQAMVDNQLEVEQTILKAVENRRQTEIDNAQDERDAIEESAQKFLDGLSEQLDKEKQLYDNNESNSEVDRLRRQLAILQRSGGSASEIRSLQDEIRQKDQDIYFEAQQQQIDAIQKASDQQLERLDHQIELMTEALEYDKEHGRLWQDVYEVMSKTPQEMMDFIMTYTPEYSSDSELQNRENIRKTMLQLETWYEYAQDQDKNALDYDANKETNYHWDNYWKSIVDRYGPEAENNEELKAKVRDAYVKGYKSTDDPNKAYDAAKKVADEALKKEIPESEAPEEEEQSNGGGGTGASNTGKVRIVYIAKYGDKVKVLNTRVITKRHNAIVDFAKDNLKKDFSGYTFNNVLPSQVTVIRGLEKVMTAYYTPNDIKLANWKSETTDVEKYEKIRDTVNPLTEAPKDKSLKTEDIKVSKDNIGLADKLGGVQTPESSQLIAANKKPVWSVKGERVSADTDRLAVQEYMRRHGLTSDKGLQAIPVMKAYATGGLADYTGLAMVHGTPSKPEAFLNAAETKMWKDEILSSGGRNSLANLLIDFRNSIGGMADSATYSTIGANGNIGDITLNMNVASIANDYDVRQAADTAMDEIVKIARRTTSVQVRR